MVVRQAHLKYQSQVHLKQLQSHGTLLVQQRNLHVCRKLEHHMSFLGHDHEQRNVRRNLGRLTNMTD